jgi:hypothetical protein
MIYFVIAIVIILILWILFKKPEAKNNEKADPKVQIETAIENEFERLVEKSMTENPDPAFGAIMTYGSIGEAGSKMKQTLYSRFGSTIPKEILDKSVEKIQSKILKKYFENF